MWPKHSKKHSCRAIFLYDGQTWYCRVFTWKKRNWECTAHDSELSQNSHEIPVELLKFAVNNSAYYARVLLPGDIFTVKAKLPSDLEPEEIYTALAFEMANETDIDINSVRLASVRESCFSMGGHPDNILAASFSIQLINKYKELCKKEGIILDGIGSIELASLNCHARSNPDAQLLLLQSNTGFYVTPETDMVPFSVRFVPLGIESLEDTFREKDRASRLARYFHHSKIPVHIWLTQALPEEHQHDLSELFDFDISIEYTDFSDMVTEIASHAAWQGHIGQVTSGCAMAAMPKAPKPPYRVGTWLFFIILAITGIYILLTWQAYNKKLDVVEQRENAWEQLLQERKKLNSEINRLKDVQSQSIAMKKLMETSILPDGLLETLNTLEENMPAYTCIDSIVEISDRSYEIHGKTLYQEGLIELNKALADELSKHSLIVVPGQVKRTETGNHQEQDFVYRIVSGEGQF